MNSYAEKIGLLMEMIAFAIVDGHLHDREYEFIWIVARELGIERKVYEDLFHRESYPNVIKSELQRIQQFYRLALLMHIDGVMHEKEEIAIKQIAINMGLNPSVTKRILKMMKVSPTRTIDPTFILDAFREQQN